MVQDDLATQALLVLMDLLDPKDHRALALIKEKMENKVKLARLDPQVQLEDLARMEHQDLMGEMAKLVGLGTRERKDLEGTPVMAVGQDLMEAMDQQDGKVTKDQTDPQEIQETKVCTSILTFLVPKYNVDCSHFKIQSVSVEMPVGLNRRIRTKMASWTSWQ